MIDVECLQGFLDGLRPISRITVSEWADKYRYLSSVSSAEPGQYRTSRTPYLKKIMDCLSVTEPYTRVVSMKGAQLGFTDAANNLVGYIIHISPAPILYVEPTEEMVRKISQARIEYMIQTSEELRSRVAPNKSRDGNNTITQKSFTGGILYLTGANSAAGLRSMPVRILILDEVDGYPRNVDNEGSPIALAEARTQSFPNKKIFMLSTPTVSGQSVIEKEFLNTDQNYYFVPCPFCGGMQRLVFEQLKWTEGKPETAEYYCVHCGAGIAEHYKVQMLEQGEWRPAVPENSNSQTIGFHLNSLYSPYGWYSWRQIAEKFLSAKNDPHDLQVFVNTTLAETWTERGEAPEYKNLYNRREQYLINSVPADVCFLTAGVDVQRDRLELEIVGWCADKRSYSIDYRVLDGDTAGTDVWNNLAKVLEERWVRDDGVEFPVTLMAVDSGFNTTHVYSFCRRYSPNRVVPIKGQAHLRMVYAAPKTVDVTKAGKRVGRLRQWNIGVSFLKEELYSHLRLEKDSEGVPPPCYCHFPQYDEHYFRGLTAEEQVRKVIKGYDCYQWVKHYERNEPLDCRVYARAAAGIVGLDRFSPEQITALVGDYGSGGSQAPAEKKKRRSSIWDN